MDELFREIREAASPRAWSVGVELNRRGTVARAGEEGGATVLVVTGPPPSAPRTVSLYPDDLEWACDCNGDEDPCGHVTAAIIAWRQAERDGTPLPEHAGPTHANVGYRFTRTPQGLKFQRVSVAGDAPETPIAYALAAIVGGRVRTDGPPLDVGPADREVERALGTQLSGWLPRHVLARLLDALSRVGDVRLDGEPIHASSERAGVVGRVRDAGSGFVLDIVQDPSIEEVFPGGVVRCGDVLRAVGDPDLTAEEIRVLRAGRTFGPDAVAELVSEVLPDLDGRIPIEVLTRRLPGRSKAEARLVLETARSGAELTVLPLIFYGDPPVARVDAGRLTALSKEALPARDEAAERRLARALGDGLGLEVGRKVRFSGEEALEMAERLRGFEAGAIAGEGHAAFFEAPALVPSVELSYADLEVAFDSPEHGRAEPGAVLAAWRSGARLVALEGGGLAPLPAGWLAEHGDLVADLLAAKAGREKLPTCALPDLGRLAGSLDLPRPRSLDKLAALLGEGGALPEPALPKDLTATLRPYQKAGVRWLAFLRDADLGGLLADDMGLGKTLQALCVVRGRTLVVSPTSVLHGWADEAARFRPGLRVSVYHGPGRALDPDADLTLTTYAILRLDAEALAAADWDTVVLDEAQTVKNPDSQVARAAVALPGGFRLALTGTPVENRLEDLWSQMNFAVPGLLGSREDFEQRITRAIADGAPGAAARLRERIRPFVLRRLKSEVAKELPPRTDVVLRCTLTGDERAVYDAVRAATRTEIAEKLGAGGSVLAALEALLRLRQAACHPALVPGREADGSSKVALLLETLEEALDEDHKALVFSQWTSLLDLVEPHLRAAGIEFVRLDGSTRDRKSVVSRFQSDDGPKVMLVSLKAGGTGLNLTAADHVFLLDPWWNPAVEDQAADRAHRIGQSRPVLVHRLVAEDTVDERILALQEEKRSLADAALGEADRAAHLGRDEILALLD